MLQIEGDGGGSVSRTRNAFEEVGVDIALKQTINASAGKK